MAGTLPDPPGYLFNLAIDGTELWSSDEGVLSQLDNSILVNTRGDRVTTDQQPGIPYYGAGADFIAFWFPQLRDISAIHISSTDSNDAHWTIQWSPDTTTLLNGTWTTSGSTYSSPNPSGEVDAALDFRQSYRTVSATGVRALRLVSADGQNNFNPATIAIWGTYASGANPHRLELVDTGGSTRLAANFFDFGDTMQGTTSTKSFKVRNLSPTKVATTVTVSVTVDQDVTPSMTSQYLLSTDGSTWLPSVSLGNIAASSSSATIQLRRQTSASAFLGVARANILATPTGGMV